MYRAYDDRAQCETTNIPYKRADPSSSYALTVSFQKIKFVFAA